MEKLKQIQQSRLNEYYPVKDSGKVSVKDVDLSKRTVLGILNTSYFIDSQFEMVIPNAAKKTLKENGTGKSGEPKVKWQTDHSLKVADAVGRFDVLEERKIDGKDCLYFEGYIPESEKGDTHLTNYQTGVYDQHSIGFQRVNYTVAEKDSKDAEWRKNWEKYYPLALNPEAADDNGYFFILSEYKLFEGSVVSFGANKLTSYLGVKSTKQETYIFDLFNRLDFLEKLRKNQKGFELEILQLKQILTEFIKPQKSTLCKMKPQGKRTYDTLEILTELRNQLKS